MGMKEAGSVVRYWLLSLGFLLSPGITSAVAADGTGGYAGIGGGRSAISTTPTEIAAAFAQDDGFVATNTTLQQTDAAWKLFVGYAFGPHFAMEAGYVDLGTAAFDTLIVAAPPPLDATVPFPLHGSARARGVSLAAVGMVPISERLALLAKGGAFYWNAEFREQVAGVATPRVAVNTSGENAMWGAGLQWKIGEACRLRLEWEHFEKVGAGIGGREGRAVEMASLSLAAGY